MANRRDNNRAGNAERSQRPAAARSTPRDPRPVITRRRKTTGAFPELLPGEFLWAAPELRGMTHGELAMLLTQTEAWQGAMVPLLEQLESERSQRGGGRAYTLAELELAFVYQRLSGQDTWAGARAILAGDRAQRCRRALGFDNRDRRRVGRNKSVCRSRPGIPSEKTMQRHVKEVWGWERHAQAYEHFAAALRTELFTSFPRELAEELRHVYIDGTDIETRYREGLVEGCGRRQKTETKPSVKGFSCVTAVSQLGTPLGCVVAPINTSETRSGELLLDTLAQATDFRIDRVGVLTADSAFSGREMRTRARTLGYVMNSHPVSHADREKSKRNAADTRNRWYAIEGFPDWKLNGHCDAYCQHGHHANRRRAGLDRNGVAYSRVEGTCSDGCGNITLTAGDWRKAAGGKRYVKARPDEKHVVNWRVGNPLTFDDPLSAEFGSGRYGRNEGFHGVLQTRFRLIDRPKLYRSTHQAERDMLATHSVMLALSLHVRRLRQAAGPNVVTLLPKQQPPGLSPPLAEAA